MQNKDYGNYLDVHKSGENNNQATNSETALTYCATVVTTLCQRIMTLFTPFNNTFAENPGCPCNKGDQTVDHIIYSCGLHKQERKRLKAALHSSGK
jgi:hypothetical protein